MASFQLEWYVYQQDYWLITDHSTLADKLLGFNLLTRRAMHILVVTPLTLACMHAILMHFDHCYNISHAILHAVLC